ncbi:hypothetical protein AQUCO_04400030v1 [Aquilegia coerulea]|uniref:Pectinesterase inhibitor domain-containing protein n=1 Tax=Aquilegia coerulea TaxID=218851 RepID=A0A2G5CMN8_AQUCA|nr:hypothetical protein AQUCO_04400030v1 [Aquilegia coerulea]PIA32555.1 hypothetical protein AQUCO_04400030v1 [Aquilegia coerulea]
MTIDPFRLLLSFSLLLLLLHGVFCDDLINQTCKKVVEGDPNVNLDFCTSTLQAVPSSHTADLDELVLISMNLTKANATHTISYIQRLLKQKMRPYTRSCLIDCLELYSDAMSSLNTAMNDCKLERYYEANIQLSATMDAPTTCEDGFKQKKSTKSPLRKRNRDMFQLGAIALSIINMLSKSRI